VNKYTGRAVTLLLLFILLSSSVFALFDKPIYILPSSGGGSSYWQAYEAGSNIYYNAGNVGIGIDNAQYPLDVNSGTSTVIVDNVTALSSYAIYDEGVYFEDNQAWYFAYNIYAYKIVDGQRIYSETPALLELYTDGSTNLMFKIFLSWDAVSGADGYRIVAANDDYDSFYGDWSYDTTDTSAIIDGPYDSLTSNAAINEGVSGPFSPYETNLDAVNVYGNEYHQGTTQIKGNLRVLKDDDTEAFVVDRNNNVARISSPLEFYFGQQFIGSITPRNEYGFNILMFNVGTNSNMAVQRYISLSDGVAFASVNDENLANLAMEFRATKFYFWNGRVGIHNTNPAYDLDVSGNVRATGYVSSDGSTGITRTQTFKDGSNVTKTMTIKNGLITAIT
jgi:hypothetical protein